MDVLNRFRLDGKVAVITGGSKGLGKAMAEGFADAGASVVVCSRDPEQIMRAADQVAATTQGVCTGHCCDVTDPADVARLVEHVLSQFGGVDIWVNNAGMNIRHPIESFPVDEFSRILDVNLTGTWLCCREVAPTMKKQRHGSVINVSSVLGTIGLAERSAYCASKYGVVGLTKTLALEWAASGVRCNALCPGPFLTEMNHALLDDPVKAHAVVGQTAMKRWAELDEIRGPALFLASDASSYMTGASLVVDGGWSAA